MLCTGDCSTDFGVTVVSAGGGLGRSGERNLRIAASSEANGVMSSRQIGGDNGYPYGDRDHTHIHAGLPQTEDVFRDVQTMQCARQPFLRSKPGRREQHAADYPVGSVLTDGSPKVVAFAALCAILARISHTVAGRSRT